MEGRRRFGLRAERLAPARSEHDWDVVGVPGIAEGFYCLIWERALRHKHAVATKVVCDCCNIVRRTDILPSRPGAGEAPGRLGIVTRCKEIGRPLKMQSQI